MEEELARGIQGVVGPIRRRARFGLGLVLTAIATLLLPLIYLAVVLATCYVVYLHLVYDTWIIADLTLWRLVAYLGPALAGAVVVFFLWKPLHDALIDLSARAARQPEDETVATAIMEKLARLHVDIQKLEKRLSQAPYPFDHAKGALSIGGFVTHGLPDVDGLGAQVHADARIARPPRGAAPPRAGAAGRAGRADRGGRPAAA
jgi:hypothetical protein